MTPPKVLIIGIDGASWNLINSMIKSLPNLKYLIRHGVHGNFKSTIPPVTFPAWKSYSTGKNPGKLGVYEFANVDLKNKKIWFANSKSFKSRDVWDYIGETGHKVAIINMPGTYPVKKVNGVMIGGPFSFKGYTYPSELEKQLEKEFDYSPYSYELSKEFFNISNLEQLISIGKKLIKSRFEVAKYLLREGNYSFLHLTIFCIDCFQHFLWDSKETRRLWKYIDKNIGELLKSLNGEWKIFIMSDHGFTKLKGIFYQGTWLKEKGLLKFHDPSLLWRIFTSFHINSTKIFDFLKKTGILALVKNLPSFVLQDYFEKIPLKDERGGLTKRIDWNNSKVIALSNLIYLNVKNSEERKELSDYLIKNLKKIKNPTTGELIIKKVFQKEEIYLGKEISNAPDLIIHPNDGYRILEIVRKDCYFREEIERNEWIAKHAQNGIFIAYGSGIKKGEKLDDIQIYDLTPTILHIFGIPIPMDIDGVVLKEIFEKDNCFAKREVIYHKIEDEKLRIQQKIKELKQIGKL